MRYHPQVSTGWSDDYWLTKEDYMARKKGKSVSFDAMIKFFIRNYNIPTKKDVSLLAVRLDRIEELIRINLAAKQTCARGDQPAGKKMTRRKSSAPASDKALEIIKRFKSGIGFADIQSRTGFEEKKLRNIIFRLNKFGRIERKSRGIYIAS